MNGAPSNCRALAPGLLLCLSMLVACSDGGDGGSGTPPPAPQPSTLAVNGLAADSAVWAAAEVALQCADGSAARTLTGPDGRYSLRMNAAALPCLLQATSIRGDRLWSAATAGGTVNITPGSDWVVSRTLRQSSAGLRPDLPLVRALGAAAVAQGQAEVRQALTAAGLAAADMVTAPLSGANDPLLTSQQQVLVFLAARDIDPLLLRHALALSGDMTALSSALQRGRLPEALALPGHQSAQASSPQLASGLFSNLTGPPTTLLGVNAEGSWLSTDGGLNWTYVNQVLQQVLRLQNRLWARDLNGVATSDDGGRTWNPQAPAPASCRPAGGNASKDLLWLSPQGRLWFFPDSSCGPVANSYTDDGLSWQQELAWDGGRFRLEMLQSQADRQPPLRQIFFRDASRQLVTSCLQGECVDSPVLDWPFVQGLQWVGGSGEVVATLADQRTGRPASMALSADGIRWQPMGFLPFNNIVRVGGGGLLASPGASPGVSGAATPGVNLRAQRSDDQGLTWRPSDPAVGAVDGWLSLGADTRLRRVGAEQQLSVDAGRSWLPLPTLDAQRDRRGWQRAPDGTLLRDNPNSIQASTDAGLSWRDVVSKQVGADAVVVTRGPVWLEDRWALIKQDRLLTSADGLLWTDAPLGLLGTVWAGAFAEAPVVDEGVWVMQVTVLSPGHQTRVGLLESRDRGRSWTDSARGDALAPRCGNLRYRFRPVVPNGSSDWQARTDSDPTWRTLPLPTGVARDAAADLVCDQGLLMVRVGGLSAVQRLPYSNPLTGARGLSHWVSPNHGRHWFAVGRPGTDLFRVDGRWWSLGLDSVMLWP